jgi:CoA:oxalate CoA-transferase
MGTGAEYPLFANPIKLSAYDDPPSRAPAPDLDANRDAILSWLGLSQTPPKA